MKLLKKMVWLLILLSAIAAGWVYFPREKVEKPTFRTEKVTRADISAVVTATGTLNPVQLITVGSQVSGKINKMLVQVNDHVKAGQLLAEIDPSLLEAQLKQDNSALESAKVAFEQADRDLKRNRLLLAKDFIAKHDLELAEQSYLQARNGYDSAKTVIEKDILNLNYAKITSPIDGVIIGEIVTEGQTLQASQQVPDMFRIAGSLTDMKIDVNFSESDIPKIKVGQPVTFTVTAFPDRIFNGTVQTVNLNPTGQFGQSLQISPPNQAGGVTYSVVIGLKNEDGALLPGMTANVSVILSQQKNVLRVPLSALRFNPPKEEASSLGSMLGAQTTKSHPTQVMENEDSPDKTLYVLRNAVLTPVPVTTGASDDTYVEITKGDVNEGDQVIVGMKKLKKN